ncbi:MAG: hypothetical protein GVY27_10445, partial [Deinococcus-Thermus bacterium]|nr:hypothetical protein [Deinococcota bacterium]
MRRRRPFARGLAAVAVAVGVALLTTPSSAALATSILERSLATLLERADLRVYGDVVSRASERTDDGEIWTTVTIDVVRDLDRPDDPEAPETRELRFLGGTLDGGRTAVVDGVPRLQEGERILVLAYTDENLASPVAGVWQGLWRVGAEGLTDERGRVLGLDQGVVRLDGPERDVDAVLDALAAGADVGPPQPRADVARDSAVEDAPPPEASDSDAAGAEPETEPEGPGDGDATDVPGEVQAEPSADAPADGDPADDEAAADAPPPGQDAPEEEAAPEGPVATITVRIAAPEDEELRAALREAADAWREAGAPLDLALDDQADDAVRIGPEAWFGPDALALSRRTPDAAGVEILLAPGPDGRRTDVLARELGLLAGLPLSATPVASGLLPVGDAAPVRPEDAQALANANEGPVADLNGDGAVDVYDLARLAESYGEVGTRLPADLDRSGQVDDADVELLRAA